VKHSYHEVWTQYKKILKQRNALLKTNPSYASVLPWDAQLGACGEVLTQMRAAYIEDWRPCFYAVLDALGGLDCEMIFYKGWGRRQKELALSDLLKSSFEQDKLRQTTQQGPHQADILLNVEEIHTRYGLSRGQQKILVLALKLSQVLMLKKPCVVLLDDVAAELDEEHLSAVVKFLQSMDVQCFMSFIPMHRQVIEALFKNVDANFFQLQ
jgi:DNA replication and repair protein RecF